MTEKTICVLGGTGFVGHHLVSQLTKAGYFGVVPSRKRERHRSLLVLPEVEVVDADIHDEDSLKALFVGCHAVINLVAILNENKRGDFNSVHVELPRKIIAACEATGVTRLLHMSALNANAEQGSSAYLRSKGEGEQQVMQSGLDVSCFRPSVMFGPDDHFFNKFAALLQYLPVLPLACPDSRMAPVFVGDIAELIVKSLNDKTCFGQRYDLCGPEVYTLKQLVDYTVMLTGYKRPVIGLSNGLSALQGRIMSLLPGKPFSYDNYLSLQTAAVCNTPFPAQFGIKPATLDTVVPFYIGQKDSQGRYDNLRQHASRDSREP